MTEQLVELMARALADACPTPDQCADTHDQCVRQHGVHWLAVGPGGIGPQFITSIEGSPTAIARIVVSALTAAGLLPVEREWSIRYPGGTVQRTGTFTEAGARQRADALAAEPVWRYVGPWQSDTDD